MTTRTGQSEYAALTSAERRSANTKGGRGGRLQAVRTHLKLRPSSQAVTIGATLVALHPRAQYSGAEPLATPAPHLGIPGHLRSSPIHTSSYLPMEMRLEQTTQHCYVGSRCDGHSSQERRLACSAAFARVELAQGESREVRFRITPRDLSCWDTEQHAWRVAPGTREVFVGASSRDLRLRGMVGRV